MCSFIHIICMSCYTLYLKISIGTPFVVEINHGIFLLSGCKIYMVAYLHHTPWDFL